MDEPGATRSTKGASSWPAGGTSRMSRKSGPRDGSNGPYFNNDKSPQFDAPTDMAGLEDLTVRYHRQGVYLVASILYGSVPSPLNSTGRLKRSSGLLTVALTHALRHEFPIVNETSFLYSLVTD